VSRNTTEDCSVEECPDPVVARGLCKRHYEKWRRSGRIPRHDHECRVPGCEEHVHARKLCSMHYHRWRRTGDPGEATSTYGTTTCQVPDCGKPHRARGYCVAHYKRYADADRVVCRRPECEEPVRVRGLCQNHYQQVWYHHGISENLRWKRSSR
jgi:hypothetical protein